MLDEDRVRQLAEKTASAKDGMSMEGPQRERGLWSFLTWSFYLVQLAIGNAFAGGAAQAANGMDNNAPAGADSTGANSTSTLGSPDFRAFQGEDPQSATLPGAVAQRQGDASAPGPDLGGIARLDPTGDTGSAPRSAAAQNDGPSEGSAAQPDVPLGANAGDAGAAMELPPINVELPPLIGVPPVLEGLLPPIFETVDNLVDSLGPTLDGLLMPVVETVEDLAGVLGSTLGIVLSPVETLVEGITSAVEPTIEAVLAPLESVVEGVVEGVGDIIEPIGGGIEQIVALANSAIEGVDAALTPVESLVDATLPVIEPVLEVAAPVIDALQPVTNALLEILPLNIGGGLPFGGSGETDVVGSPGDLHFAVGVETVVHELFQAGAYTEYGLEMQQTPAGTENGVGELIGNIAVPIEALLGDDDGAGNGPQTFFGGLQLEAGLRGLGDGLI